MWRSILGDAHELRAERAAAQAALAVIAGILLSGPLALLTVAFVHPQPPWQGPARFAAEFHTVQLLPYLGGFALVGGCIALVATLCALVPPERRGRAGVALVLAAAFAALIVLNYILQAAFVPALVSPYRPEDDALITAFTMSNPRSLAWALEMWGYGVLGVATWAVAVVFGSSRLERATAAAFRANGVASVAGALATARWPGWELTPAGGVAFGLWNLLMIVMAALVIAAMTRRSRQATTSRPDRTSAGQCPDTTGQPGRQ